MGRKTFDRIQGASDTDPCAVYLVVLDCGGITSRTYITGTRKHALQRAQEIEKKVRELAEKLGDDSSPTSSPNSP